MTEPRDDYTKPGWHLIHQFPDHEWVMSTTMWREKVIVVTSEGVYVMKYHPLYKYQIERLEVPWW